MIDNELNLWGNEEEILEMLSKVAELFNAVVTKRDPGPENDAFSRAGICRHCYSALHTTVEHDEKLMDRIANEVAAYNRDVLGAQ